MTNLFVSSVSYQIYSCENNQYIVKVAYCKIHMTVLGNICPFFERTELWFQASGTLIL